jgi:hypothetical protein
MVTEWHLWTSGCFEKAEIYMRFDWFCASFDDVPCFGGAGRIPIRSGTPTVNLLLAATL